MTPEEKMKRKIIKEYGAKYNLNNNNFEVVIQEKAPEPSEIASKKAVIESLGKVGKYFVYAVKEGFTILFIICGTFVLYEPQTYFDLKVPSNYEFISQNGEQIRNGNMTMIQEENKKPDCYVILQTNWINNKNEFLRDHNDIESGNLSSLNSPSVFYAPATGSVLSVSSGTYKLGK